MAMTLSGDGTITGLVAGGLPDATVTQSDLAAGVTGNGPAFSAYQNASVSVANGTFVKLPINSEDFDTNSCFDSATNYRFTPTVAGYYQVNGCMNYMSGPSSSNTFVSIYKNGAENRRGAAQTGTNASASSVSALVYLNGSTDYIELYVFQASGATQTYNPSTPLTYFQASMARSA
jgi:hypothetical protein